MTDDTAVQIRRSTPDDFDGRRKTPRVIPHAWEGFRHSGRLGMGLAPEYRGKGIGRHLVEVTVRDARAARLTRIELEVFSSNTRVYCSTNSRRKNG